MQFARAAVSEALHMTTIRASTLQRYFAKCFQRSDKEYMISDRLHLQNPSIHERQSAHYHAMCVHASYGDVELAQISLRSEALKVSIHPMPSPTCVSSCQVSREM